MKKLNKKWFEIVSSVNFMYINVWYGMLLFLSTLTSEQGNVISLGVGTYICVYVDKKVVFSELGVSVPQIQVSNFFLKINCASNSENSGDSPWFPLFSSFCHT